MGTIDQSLNNYIWNNLNELKSMFSDRLYSSLLKKREKEDREGFTETLELIVDLDSDFFDSVNRVYQKNLSIEEVNKELENLALDDIDEVMERARYWLENYPKKDAKYAELLVNLAYINGMIIEINEAKRFATQAIEIYQEIIKSNPKDDNAYNNIGNSYSVKGEYNKAIECYQKAIKLNPKNDRAFNDLDYLMTRFNKAFFLNSKNSNLNFKIDKLEIKNFKQYKKPFSMEFSDKVNIIIGQNAIGKTTLLQAITLGLLKENSPDEETSYSEYISKGETSSKIIVSYNNSTKVVKVLKSKREIEDNYFIPFILSYGSNFFTNYGESDYIVQKVLSETIAEDFAHTIFLEHTDNFWNPLSVLRNLAISKHKTAKEKKKILFDTLNNFLEIEGYELTSTNEDETRFQFKNKREETLLTLDELSEGYRGNVLLITDMVIKILGVGWTPDTIEGIILIDKFDKHLHPKWQSKLVNQLTKTFKKIQFIMTTHNPMSILDRNPDEIIKLVETKDGIKAIQGQGTKSIDVSIVLLEYFGVESTVSETMQKQINNFNRLKLKKELTTKEKQELKELEQYLGNTIASNLIYNRPYLKFLEFIRDHKEIDFDRYDKMDEEEMDELLKDFGDFLND